MSDRAADYLLGLITGTSIGIFLTLLTDLLVRL